MGKYNCEKCGKEFNQKSHYTTHTNKKNPCVVESKIKEMIDNAVKEKLIEIKKTSPSDIINNIEMSIKSCCHVISTTTWRTTSTNKYHINNFPIF